MANTLDRALPLPARTFPRYAPTPFVSDAQVACAHCGQPCPDHAFSRNTDFFCCHGCLTVHELLVENGLAQFYELSPRSGIRIGQPPLPSQWSYLDDPRVAQGLLDFTDGKLSKVTLQIPAIHCVACVWLLENLFRLNPAVGQTTVNFAKREATFTFNAQEFSLGRLAGLLASLGYEPRLTLGEMDRKQQDQTRKRQWLRVGVAGFAFGNIMLFSLPLYLGLDSLSGPLFKTLFGWISLALALPVVLYSASDYWRSALLSFRQRVLTLDVPIVLGLAALYAQSAFEILGGRGEGYLDSLAGLILFLLCGRVFQQRTQDRIVFDRDYKSFFPLAVLRRTAAGEESAAINHLKVGDKIVLRHGELIPADARLLSARASIDYSFVTGEASLVEKIEGDYLYAGGKQSGAAIEIETVKPVSQSYLTSLWGHEAFQKNADHELDSLTNLYSRRFTRLVIAIAAGAAAFWIFGGDAARGFKAFTSVLIVACPCALALAAPFVLGTAQRLLAKASIFLKRALVLERMARVQTIVFDKTGTLTDGGEDTVTFVSARSDGAGLDEETRALTARLAAQSAHPLSCRIHAWLAAVNQMPSPSTARLCDIEHFEESTGRGLRGLLQQTEVLLGSPSWLKTHGVSVPCPPGEAGTAVGLAIDGQLRGWFVVGHPLREEIDQLVLDLSRHYELVMLSGDNERERDRFTRLFGASDQIHFNQSPLDKLSFIKRLQEAGETVMMVGDGLNDAGALKQSDVGVAVVEKIGSFSPASDVIMDARQVRNLGRILNLARRSTRLVKWAFALSAAYNLVGISIAAAGILSPLICAILMPVSSVSVVLFACAATRWAARREGLERSAAA